MAPLPNVRHEKFVQALFEGKSATEAYTLAGYKPHQGNSSRLRWYEMVQGRLRELQSEAARSTKVTLESIIAELNEAAAIAKERGQGQALVSVASLKAKLSGLLTEKIEIGGPGAFDNLYTTPAIVDRVLEEVVAQFRPVDQADKEALIQIYERQFQEVQDFLDSIRNRPLLAERVDTRRLDRPCHELQTRSPPTRLRGNGAG